MKISLHIRMRKEQETKMTEDCAHTELHHKAEEDDKDESTSAKHFIRVACKAETRVVL